MQLTDSHGRHIHKLRVQLTDACNFRCFYCMPENIRFQSQKELLTAEEIIGICSTLASLGLDEIRVTGGEPTLRAGFEGIMAGLSDIPWTKFGLTTNASLLEEKLSFLKNDTTCRSINISLDSLEEEKFHALTRRKNFRQVYRAVLAAKEMGFQVKINVILFRGLNDMEVPNFLHFSATHGIEVRFLELMKVGPAHAEHTLRFISAGEVIDRIRASEELIPVEVSADSTSFTFLTPRGARLGFIASESRPFCGACSRLRLSATGKLRACLFSEAGLDLRGANKLDYPELLRAVMHFKPTGRLPHIHQPMNQIGG